MPSYRKARNVYRAQVSVGDGRTKRVYDLGSYDTWAEARIAEIDHKIWLLGKEREHLATTSVMEAMEEGSRPQPRPPAE